MGLQASLGSAMDVSLAVLNSFVAVRESSLTHPMITRWIVPLVTGVALAPESPWLLVRKGKMDEARKNLLRLTSLNRETDFDVDETLAVSTVN